MKVMIFEGTNHTMLQNSINEFLAGGIIVTDISFSTCNKGDSRVYYSCLVQYEEPVPPNWG